MKIEDNVARAIRDAKAKEPSLSLRELGRRFGVHNTTVMKVLSDISETTPKAKPSETHERTADSWSINIPYTRIQTLEQLIEHCQIDLDEWEVDRFVANKWEVGAKNSDGDLEVTPLFQVKAFLKKRQNISDAKAEIALLKELAFSTARYPTDQTLNASISGNMLEVNLPDVHFGKMAWAVETGWSNYDVKIAVDTFKRAISTLLSRVAGYQFDQILFVVGNDLLNSDDVEGRTTAGTSVTTDGRYHKTFSTVRTLMAETINDLRKVAPVKVVMVGGNHDRLSVWHLGDSLECLFCNYKDVEIDNTPKDRKYYQFGQVMLMFTHGDKGKQADYPMKMAVEQPKMFGETKYREAHVGHHHKLQSDLVRMRDIDESHGVRVRKLSALTPPDDWHSQNGYIGNLEGAELYIWNKDKGLIGTACYVEAHEGIAI